VRLFHGVSAQAEELQRGRRRATRDDGATGVGARHSLTSLHASRLHGLHHIHGRAASRTVAHHATGTGKGLAIGELAVRERRGRLLQWRLWQRVLRLRRKAAERGLLAVEGLVIHRTRWR
jgi:hypothetical protein